MRAHYRASRCEGSSRDGKRGNNSRSKHCSRWTGEWRVFPKICTGIFVPTIYFQTNAVPGTNSKKLINIESYMFLATRQKGKMMLRTSVLVTLCASATVYVPAGQVSTFKTAFPGMENEMTLERNAAISISEAASAAEFIGSRRMASVQIIQEDTTTRIVLF